MIKKIINIGLGLILMIGLSGCGQGVEKENLKIGAMVPLSGAFAPYGEVVKRGILAGIGDSDVEIVFEDSVCDAKSTITAYRKLVDVDGIKNFIGPACGNSQNALAPIVTNTDHTLMFMSTPAEELYELSGKNAFAAQYSIEEESQYNAEKMYEAGHEKVAMLFYESNFGRAHEKTFIEVFPGEVVDVLTFSETNTGGIKPLLMSIKELDVDAIYVPDAYPFLLGLMTEMRKLGIDIPVYSIFSLQMPDVLEVEGENVEGVIYSFPDIEEGNDANSYFSQLGTEMMIKAVTECDGDSGCVKEYLHENYEFGNDGVLDNEIILKTIRDGQFVNL